MVHQVIEQCRCHVGITEDIGPFAEAQIGRDDNAGLLNKCKRSAPPDGLNGR